MDESNARDGDPDVRDGEPDRGTGDLRAGGTDSRARRTDSRTEATDSRTDTGRPSREDSTAESTGARPDDAAATGLPMTEEAAREAADAFGVLADPLRVRILATLWQEHRRGPVAYSDLKGGVGVRDSGRFNYHLSQLTGRFLEKTEDGYGLTATGLYVLNLLAAGAFTDTPELPPEPVGTDCPTCDGELHARYEGAEHIVQCPECETAVNWLSFPPAGVRDRPREELPRAVFQRSRRLFDMAHDGICPFCGREMQVELFVPDDGQFRPYGAAIDHDCDGCKGHIGSTLGAYLSHHPAVVAFRYDHGEAPGDRPHWTVDFVRDPDATELLQDDPPRARLTVERGDERLELDVDADGTVVGERRVRDV
jgi:hypothetical protein